MTKKAGRPRVENKKDLIAVRVTPDQLKWLKESPGTVSLRIRTLIERAMRNDR